MSISYLFFLLGGVLKLQRCTIDCDQLPDLIGGRLCTFAALKSIWHTDELLFRFCLTNNRRGGYGGGGWINRVGGGGGGWINGGAGGWINRRSYGGGGAWVNRW
jgi:hypothetical protein